MRINQTINDKLSKTSIRNFSNQSFSKNNLYNPPNIELPFELFLDISRKCGKFLIGGDLNAKTKNLGCFSENENGIILEKIINKFNLSSDYYEILDIFLIPSSLSDRVVDFKVLIDHDMLSDHFPIQADISQIGISTKIYLSLVVIIIIIRKTLKN
ncbi:hypothetical protein BpHYR1_029965 [Brachionus plicatilis]|uniref:Endonuclease/exonuclease/phosphatase domain-containing protein n=1 Tax=Brachionus plicatilis TaxID=10195 RepID=A0A3M7PYC5_BRAPC|nr:hypothetical protein BpHYR1_029965 [Brachionus plicatilis]